MLFAVDQRRGVVAGKLETMAVRDRVGWASLDAIAAENAAIVIDVVDLGVAFGTAEAGLGGVFRGLDIDAVCRTRGGTEETRDAFFQTVFVALEDVSAAKTFLQLSRAIGVFFRNRGMKHLFEGDAHALGDRCRRFDYLTEFRHFLFSD